MAPPLVYGCSSSSSDGSGGKALMKEALDGNLRRLEGEKALMKEALDRNPTRLKGATRFMVSAQSGDDQTVKYVLGHGSDTMKATDEGHTALHHAVAAGCCKVYDFILSKGAPVVIDCGCGTPLDMAANNKQDTALKVADHGESATLYASRNLCKLLMGDGAQSDALRCRMLRSNCGKAFYCQAAAHMVLKLCTMPTELAVLHDCKEQVEMLFPSPPVENAQECIIEGVISHGKIADKKPMSLVKKSTILHDGYEEKKLAQGLPINVCNELVHVVPLAKPTAVHVKNKDKERPKMDTIQLYVKIGQLETSVFIHPQATVREAIFHGSYKLGICLYDYYLVYGSRYLNLDVSIYSQGILPCSFLVPRCRTRGGVLDRLKRTDPFVVYTNRFGDRLFDLCHVPGARHGIAVCLSPIGVEICSLLVRMVRLLFALQLSAPVFTASDIIYDRYRGCFTFDPDFKGFQQISNIRFAKTMECLGSLIRRTFCYDRLRLNQGRANFHVRTPASDTDPVPGEIPEYLKYLLYDLSSVRTIVRGALITEILDYIEAHIALKTTAGRIGYEMNLSIHFFYYPGGFAGANYFMRRSPLNWFDDMVYPLDQVQGYGSLPEDYGFQLPRFCNHTRNLVSHPDVHGLTEKQADALIMMHASVHLYLVNIELMLRIPRDKRVGGFVPVSPPTFTPQPAAGVRIHGPRLTIKNGLTCDEVCRM